MFMSVSVGIGILTRIRIRIRLLAKVLDPDLEPYTVPVLNIPTDPQHCLRFRLLNILIHNAAWESC